MVKPLNKEWELFGRKYRVPGAKGDKVDCNACQKQVSAAVNRLQSHLRVCPARATLPVTLSMLPTQTANDLDDSNSQAGGQEDEDAPTGIGDSADSIDYKSDLGDHALDPNAALAVLPTGSTAASVSGGAASGTNGTTTSESQDAGVVTSSVNNAAGPPAVKRQRTSPSRLRDRNAGMTTMDDFWLAGATAPPFSSNYAKKSLELEEKKLKLEMKKDQREERRELFQLEILECQARKERLLVEKETYETKVLLALSRKQLRDQGVSEEEIDRILPIDGVAKAADGQC